ncbi:Leukotriene A-4 hydrolase [Galdieria sulphuraria]|uniref:Leukotriene-A4 hydrolase n=1 Tax=Galdieria sulphuraria TaxID=130081 RepID=M2X3W2_GALSU|nr:leukotriene-A4 hydrolase [Galdieria sulphuraria]EME31115.1 leukotriene-A4 hydrolase [Galdieria sulphuraria]GJD12416.1 Leukotriene A-4 hydrolase [Galdieria sulphuraria]|eukprot:XP_005707635.1 leukotriene-A4 hydrolase [Galdieria sulphuraria]
MTQNIVVHPPLQVCDACTYSDITRYFTRKLTLELDVDPFQRHIRGVARIVLECLRMDADAPITLDIRGLKIGNVENTTTRKQLDFIEVKGGKFGDILKIFLDMPVAQEHLIEIAVTYETSSEVEKHPAGSCCGWLSPEQTVSGKSPYLFTQSQPIHARSLFPCQDSPSVKAPYLATVSVPAGFKAIMSGILVNEKEHFETAKGKLQNIYRFEQSIPVPSYLVSLAVGDFESQELSERCRIWSEPEIIESACFEFGSTEQFLKTAESIAGFYLWSRYDLLCLPPFFPYGGMENPCLAFVTSTLLVGDRSLVYVIINEIAHSWSGNLVTCASWEHLWLNDGIATYLARKIIARVLHSQNPSRAKVDAFFGLEASIGRDALQEAIHFYGEEHNYTRLVPIVHSQFDPDDSFSVIPAEKGFNMLLKLEREIGGEERLLRFLRSYFEHFKFQSITTDEFVSYFSEYFDALFPDANFDSQNRIELSNFDWNTWLYGTGEPPEYASFDLSLVNHARQLAQQCLDTQCEMLTWHDVEEWETTQMVVFLNHLLASDKLTYEAVKKLDFQIRFSQGRWSRNAEVRFIWLRVSLRNHYEPSVENAIDFITSQGRMKYIRPIYKDLYYIYPRGDLALKTFEENRHRYHSIAVKLIARDLELIEN